MTLHHELHAARYLFNPRIQYKDDVHNDGEVMRGTMNVITRIARSMHERLDVVAEDMKIIHNHPNNKEAKGKHNSNMGDMKANKGKQGMIGDMGLHIHPFLVPQNCHIQISALVVGIVIWAIFKLLDMVVSSLRDTQEKVQVNKQQHRETWVGQTPLESAGSKDPTRPESGSAGSDSPSRPDSAIHVLAQNTPRGGVPLRGHPQQGGPAARDTPSGVFLRRTTPSGVIPAQGTPSGVFHPLSPLAPL
ncbi:hypothetical protein Taro_018159 [Colocasia esculenta]|uniref:Uncharacterized protein n=1 Tax=Colocasia esculenta TaxID=4460 RepID=A0A843UQP7_COLES|nr:hypothetical protein [Colocasia esculenta]